MPRNTNPPADPTPEAPAAAAPAVDLTALAKAEEHEITPGEVNVPPEIKAFVDQGHKFWQGKPKKWRRVTLANADAVKFVTNKSRKYAAATSRTFRVNKAATTDTVLVYKVTDKFQKQATEAASDE